MVKLTLTRAQTFGKVSDRNRKMPASTFDVHTEACGVGGKLRAIEGSTCHKCYAMKFERMYPSVDMGHRANLTKSVALIASHPKEWSEAIATQIISVCNRKNDYRHRWFSAGDLQSLAMLRAIVRVCELTPRISHWLPTREARIVKAYLKAHGSFPDNLVVRISSTMIGDAPIAGHANTSTVHRKSDIVSGHECDASTRGDACGDCAACWDKSVPNVSYPLH